MQEKKRSGYGVACGIFVYVLWGLLPAYWKLIKTVPAYEILAHRIVWSFLFTTILVVLMRRTQKLKETIKNWSIMRNIVLCSVLVSVNWFVYIWAVNNNHIVDASLGYYITPFVSVVLGMVVLGEKLQRIQLAALALACVGVLIKIIVFGEFPWISIVLALSFGSYGLFKKRIAVDSATGLSIETLVTAPFALIFLVYIGLQGQGSFLSGAGAGISASVSASVLTSTSSTASISALLAFTGVITAVPLLLFSEAAKNLQLTTIGFLQYIAPSISLVLGVLVYKEGFFSSDFITFGLIWTALALYSFSIIKKTAKK